MTQGESLLKVSLGAAAIEGLLCDQHHVSWSLLRSCLSHVTPAGGGDSWLHLMLRKTEAHKAGHIDHIRQMKVRPRLFLAIDKHPVAPNHQGHTAMGAWPSPART